MLDLKAHDGAARLLTWKLGERTLEAPGILWLDEELGPEEAGWEPTLSRSKAPGALLLNTASFQREIPSAGDGQVLLQRQLEAPPAMLGGRVRLHAPHEAFRVFSGAASLFRNPKRFAPALTQARHEAGHAALLYAPGLGEPAHLALLAYAGVDVFDSVPLSFAAVRGAYLTEHGSAAASDLASPECPCAACAGRAPATLGFLDLRRHNQFAARAELGVVRNALRQGRLRELVEARVRSHPELTALLRRLDAQVDHFESRTPVTSARTLFANTKESFQRPEVRRFRDRIRDRYRPRIEAPFLLLLPCSHRKPYGRSRTHRAIHEALWASGAATLVHEVILTSPLGLVPRELETTYPAAHYDVPVTGEWDPEEGEMIRGLLASLLEKRTYERILVHVPRHTRELVAPLLPADAVVTCEGDDATKLHELQRLELTLRNLARDRPRRPMALVLKERLHGIADYQFGPEAADALLRDTTAAGRWPTVRLLAGEQQVAILPDGRGLLSLTLEGARRLASVGAHVVEIEDFNVSGSVFAVGIRKADPRIRIGDEVVVAHEGDVRAVGVAAMSGPEMTELGRGEAVKVRHHA